MEVNQGTIYLPLNGDVHQFLEDFFDMIADEYNMEDHYVECGNQEWHLYDPPACWANLNISPNMTIFIKMEEINMDILVEVNNGSEDPDDYEEEEFWLSLRDDEQLEDLVDMVMNISIDLGDHFKIYVDGFIKNDYQEVLRSVFWEMNPNNYVVTFVKVHVDETSSSSSSSESEVEDDVVNQVIFEDLAFPFEKISLPLRNRPSPDLALWFCLTLMTFWMTSKPWMFWVSLFVQGTFNSRWTASFLTAMKASLIK